MCRVTTAQCLLQGLQHIVTASVIPVLPTDIAELFQKKCKSIWAIKKCIA